jgi:tetratricopeptide (TPR) repeat protein
MANRLLLLLLLLGSACFDCLATGPGGYQLIGHIIFKDREFSRSTLAIVSLDGTRTVFSADARADLSGKFTFKNLQPDLYTITVYIPRAGEWRQTVEISPTLADSKKRVFVNVVFQPDLGSNTLREVTPAQLATSDKAWGEFEKARKRLGKGDSEGAIACLKKAVKIAPQFTEAWNTLGTLAYASGRYGLAEEYFREALKSAPGYYPPLVNLGGALLTQGKLQDSLPLNIAAVRARSDDALANSQLGLNYYYLKQYTEAERYLKQAISLDPGHFSYPQLPLADIYLHRQDFASAVRELEQFLILHPDAKQSPSVRKQIEDIHSRILSTPHPDQP